VQLPITPDSLHRIFGPAAFEPGLFYANAPALRFELSQHGSSIDLFTQAFDRAREILRYVFRDSASLVVVFVYFGSGLPIRHLSVFRSLRECGIRLQRPWTCWAEVYGADFEPEQRTFVAFRISVAALDRILWGALAADFNIHPKLQCRAYIADPELGILAHPYDDRGMDVIGPNRELLAEIFHRYRDYLLGYDLPRMEEFFASASA